MVCGVTPRVLQNGLSVGLNYCKKFRISPIHPLRILILLKGTTTANYSEKEDEALVLAWENVSLADVTGTDRNSSTYANWRALSSQCWTYARFKFDILNYVLKLLVSVQKVTNT